MKIGFIGAGNMAVAMMKGMQAKHLDIFATDIDNEKLKGLEKIGVNILTSNQNIVDVADVIVLAIKPQQYKDIITNLKTPPDKIFLTMAPGITLAMVKDWSGGGRVVRTMPNTPALIGEGVTAVCFGQGFDNYELEFIKSMLGDFSAVFQIEEEQMDLAIAISGSSPIFGYKIIEIVSAFAKKNGFSEAMAKKMIAKTLIGSAMMVLASDDSPATLIDRVCSKGGTTEQLVKTLDNNNLAGIIHQGLAACVARARNLAL
ncbi:MAG: pyrroline-5-carboxylate reductase [Firmicutes bacterium]|nr:pyrroline-5-carboxylate reductase [Bacillota bacterium]